MLEPVFSSERRSEMVQFRLTTTQRAYLQQMAKHRGVSESEIIRLALDAYFAQLSEAQLSESGSPVVESKTRPASSTANVKAASKATPSKRTGRKHSSH